jgi:hypothetical protein
MPRQRRAGNVPASQRSRLAELSRGRATEEERETFIQQALARRAAAGTAGVAAPPGPAAQVRSLRPASADRTRSRGRGGNIRRRREELLAQGLSLPEAHELMGEEGTIPRRLAEMLRLRGGGVR